MNVMSTYTEFYEGMTYGDIDEENYRDEMLKIASGFRRFDEALDAFLVGHGYSGEITEVDSKITFLKATYKSNDVEIPREIKKWFTEYKKPEKKTVLTICFAFGLNLEETEDFLRRVLLERGFDCHNIDELVYYYCMSNGYGYKRAREIIDRIGKIKQDRRMDMDGELLYTSTIIEEVKKFTSDDDLISFVENNREQFEYNNVTAYKFIIFIYTFFKIKSIFNFVYREGIINNIISF